MIDKYLNNIKEKRPLIHNITNYVTVNDCANILLACGASPIMADDKDEVLEITSICDGLNINIGTLNKNTIESMIIAGKKANELGNPVVLDPVGVGASTLRRETAKKLLENIKFSVIKGNISEIKILASGYGHSEGVDASDKDMLTNDNIENIIKLAKDFSKKIESIIVITGEKDLIIKEEKVYIAENGNAMMANITGSGCMLNSLICAYCAANKENMLEAVLAGVCNMGICGEKAYFKMINHELGNSSYRNLLIDEIYKLKGEELDKYAEYKLY